MCVPIKETWELGFTGGFGSTYGLPRGREKMFDDIYQWFGGRVGVGKSLF